MEVTRTEATQYFEYNDYPSASEFTNLLQSIPFFKDGIFTSLSGNVWDGSFVSKILTANTSLTLSTTKRGGMIVVKQNGTAGWTLTINGTAVTINMGIDQETIIQFFYVDSLSKYLFVPTREIAGVSGGGPDVTPPSIVSIVISNANPNGIRITYNESLTPVGSLPISIYTVSGGRSMTFGQASGAEVFITFSSNFSVGETVTLSYSGSEIKDLANNLAAGFTGLAVTNNLTGASFPTANRVCFHKFGSMVKSGGFVDGWTDADGNAANDFEPYLGATKPIDAGADGMEFTGTTGSENLAIDAVLDLTVPFTIYVLGKKRGAGGLFPPANGVAAYAIYLDTSSILARIATGANQSNGTGIANGGFEVWVFKSLGGTNPCVFQKDGVVIGSFNTADLGSGPLGIYALSGLTGNQFNGWIKAFSAFSNDYHSDANAATYSPLFKAEGEV